MIPGGGGGGAISPYLLQNQHGLDGMVDGAASSFMGEQPHCHALLYNLSVLKDRVQQLYPLVNLAVAHNGSHGHNLDVSAADAIIQEIVAAASTMMYTFQLLCDIGAPPPTANDDTTAPQQDGGSSIAAAAAAVVKTNDDHGGGQQLVTDQDDHLMQQQQWHDYSSIHHAPPVFHRGETATATDTIIELDEAELLAKFTHYCQVCGKGFKRDANLRMHMRAHGDEYKSKAALSNPTKLLAKAGAGEEAAGMSSAAAARKYSCPQEGCRWNRRHAKFQPLKSVICAKNHYKRSHCPKMYVCNRCGRKHFSVLSDLRTHEKHCGDHRWVCSCGTSFSRKDKLVGHVALFAGHQPVVPLDAAPRGGKRQLSSAAASASSVAGNIDDATGIGSMGA